LLLFFAISSCVHDNLEEHQLQNSNAQGVQPIKEIPYGELLKTDSRFRNLHDKVMQNNRHSLGLTTESAGNTHGFTIVNTAAKVIETDSIISYTLLVEKDVPIEGAFDNLVIQTYKDDSNAKAFLLEYTPDITGAGTHDFFSFQGDIQIKDLAIEGSVIQNATEVDCGIEIYLMCSESWTGGLGSSHIATSQCININYLWVKVVKKLCGGGSGGGGGGSDPGSGNPQGPFNGSTGSGGGAVGPDNPAAQDDPVLLINNPITSPIVPVKTPCNQIKAILNQATNLKANINSLNNNTTLTLNYEKGFEYKDDANGISQPTPKNGTPGETGINIAIPANGTMNFVLHSHYSEPGMMPCFTFDDLFVFRKIQYYKKLNNKPLDKLTYMVVTQAGVFAMVIEDETALENLLVSLQGSAFAKAKREFYKKFPKSEDSDADYIKSLINSLEVFGVGLYMANDDLNNFSKLTLNDNNNIVPNPCN
jgi:hypothetical protein